MPIIINHFEIITSGEQPQPETPRRPQVEAAAPEPQRAETPAPQGLRPEDVELILRRFSQRRMRLRAD